MKLRNHAGRIIAGIFGITGLVYPACAAVCPKGHGSCPYPGKCFLYTDADANSVCDYTRTAASGSSTGNSVATQTTNLSSGRETLVTSSDTGLFSVIQQNAFLIGLLLFAILTVSFYAIIRKRWAGHRLGEPGPALALSTLSSLGVSEIFTYLLMGDDASGMASAFAAVYLIAGSLLVAYLWKSKAVSREIVLVLAAGSVIFGFVLNVLIMPAEFAGILGITLGTQTITIGAAIILAILVLTLTTGRTFCAHICPVGSIQELAYSIPAGKCRVRNARTLGVIRLAVVVGAILAAFAGIDLISCTGAYDFFSLTLSVWAGIFIVLLVAGMVIWRPVCRAICPFGLIFAGVAGFSRFRLHRTDACIKCKKCENACPAGIAGETDSRRECYLCARCTKVCPVSGALEYGKQNV